MWEHHNEEMARLESIISPYTTFDFQRSRDKHYYLRDDAPENVREAFEKYEKLMENNELIFIR